MDLLQGVHISSNRQPKKGILSFRILMKHIFGFCQDYDKIVYGFKHNLALVRKTDDDAAAGVGNDSLYKISWFMPHVTPADADYKTIESKAKLPVAYRTVERKNCSGETEIYYCWFPNS